MKYFNRVVSQVVLIFATLSAISEAGHLTIGDTVHRFYTGQGHLFTTDYEEGAEAGYSYEGAPFQLLDDGDNLRALYRCSSFNLGTRFLSRDSNCEGSYQEGFLGYVSAIRGQGLVPLHRWDNPHGVDSIVTLNYQEGVAAGYIYRRILGYVVRVH